MVRVEFKFDVIEEANGEHPRLLIVAKGTKGYILDRRGEWPTYVELDDRTVIGCHRWEVREIAGDSDL